ncbi:hypothetical protein MASR2M48_25140 [Spirochaetota bacterium]
MMYCCISVDYLSQLERTGVGEVGTFLDELRSIGCAFGATVGTRKTPLVPPFQEVVCLTVFRQPRPSVDW